MVERRNRSERKNSKRSSKRSNRSSKRSNRSSKRSNRKNTRKNRRQSGGNNFSLRQGQEFASYHTQQHGGAYTPIHGAPLDYSGALPAELRDSAHLGGYDKHYQAASGMSDATPATVPMPAQKGGARRSSKRSSKKASKKSKKASKKSKKSSKSSKKSSKSSKKSSKSSKKSSKSSKRSSRKSRSSRRNNRQRGGRMLGNSPVDSPTMLLTPSEAAKAGTGDFSNPLLKH